MLKVFLGSTFRDLKGHRQAVRDAINWLDGCKCIAMEDFALIPLHTQSVVVGARKGLTYSTWANERTNAESIGSTK